MLHSDFLRSLPLCSRTKCWKLNQQDTAQVQILEAIHSPTYTILSDDMKTNSLMLKSRQCLADGLLDPRANRPVGGRPERDATGADACTALPPIAAVRTILVPVDFTASSRYALSQALVLARPLNASIVLLHVAQSVYTGPLLDSETKARIQTSERDRAEQRLRVLAQSVEAQHPVIECLVRNGPPGHEIVRAAEALNVSMIILGQPTRNSLLKLLFGSVTRDVVDTAPCPVLVVNHKACRWCQESEPQL